MSFCRTCENLLEAERREATCASPMPPIDADTGEMPLPPLQAQWVATRITGLMQTFSNTFGVAVEGEFAKLGERLALLETVRAEAVENRPVEENEPMVEVDEGAPILEDARPAATSSKRRRLRRKQCSDKYRFSRSFMLQSWAHDHSVQARGTYDSGGAVDAERGACGYEHDAFPSLSERIAALEIVTMSNWFGWTEPSVEWGDFQSAEYVAPAGDRYQSGVGEALHETNLPLYNGDANSVWQTVAAELSFPCAATEAHKCCPADTLNDPIGDPFIAVCGSCQTSYAPTCVARPAPTCNECVRFGAYAPATRPPAQVSQLKTLQ